ncbi:MAG: Rrf2 family transcriptional regulator [Bacteroidota bacterium]
MRLTKYSDYSLRTLIYLALADRRCTIDEVARSYDIPKNHLIKVVNQLALAGYVDSSRGKGGGIQLADEPININIGDVVRETEQSFDIVECFSPGKNKCVLTPSCKLSSVLSEALNQFMFVLDEYTLEDVLRPKMRVLLSIDKAKALA